MMTKTLRTTMIAAGFVAAFGFSTGPALASPAPDEGATAAMHAGHDSMSQKASDTWITTKVKTAFATTKGVRFPDISVDTKDGVVMLTGMVPSQAEREMAIRTAHSVKGVKAVQADKLKVGEDDDRTADTDGSGTSMGQKVTDTWITTKVKTAFATAKAVHMTDISVDTTDGVVMLTGTVHSEAEKQLAIRDARGVKGVKAVEAGHLKVASSD
ncbi:BON domain-containing protein [Oleiagrimonas sp. MCCC 1A03011]|uniref:BON domain-containing protein n=1 Tax=Oleiagrimonas sp. MCCC 1A03011 TaxID=1926883 RepID=UPI000DD59A3C|nr:BON domain-containing protein [Oleiagrimonas sp. MCCC 1A03011]